MRIPVSLIKNAAVTLRYPLCALPHEEREMIENEDVIVTAEIIHQCTYVIVTEAQYNITADPDDVRVYVIDNERCELLAAFYAYDALSRALEAVAADHRAKYASQYV